MRKINKSNNLQFPIYIFFLFVFTFYILNSIFYISPALALEATSSASQSADFKNKLKSLIDDIASKAASPQFKAEMGQKLLNRAYVGTVLEASDTSLTLSTLNGPRTVLINQDTQIDKPKTITPNDLVAALGDIDLNEALIAKKIIRPTPSQILQKKVVTGVIISIDSSKITLQDRQGKKWLFTTNNKTDIQLGKSSGKLTNLKVGTSIIVVGINPKAEVYTARFIYVWPYGVLPKKIIPTISVTPISTPSGIKKKS